ncbi:alkyl sulfatase C-terminal domain-containing protein [Streptomyces sp. NPDC049555]|uniref:alkyl sulfatase C-terminal domain-containing protein n=1 Tax=Streptomyces sp. NPDC049555 TaxID=3154930 RepID=UPI003438202D
MDGPTAAEQHRTPIAPKWVFTDPDADGKAVETCTTTLRNGVLVFVHGQDRLVDAPQATITLSRKTLNELAAPPGSRRTSTRPSRTSRSPWKATTPRKPQTPSSAH